MGHTGRFSIIMVKTYTLKSIENIIGVDDFLGK